LSSRSIAVGGGFPQFTTVEPPPTPGKEWSVLGGGHQVAVAPGHD
jgi:hypothetical protein